MIKWNYLFFAASSVVFLIWLVNCSIILFLDAFFLTNTFLASCPGAIVKPSRQCTEWSREEQRLSLLWAFIQRSGSVPGLAQYVSWKCDWHCLRHCCYYVCISVKVLCFSTQVTRTFYVASEIVYVVCLPSQQLLAWCPWPRILVFFAVPLPI